MAVYFCIEFIRDLISHGESVFAKRVLQKVVGDDIAFRVAPNDHKFKGDSWIRYVSEGKTGYRAIYIKRGSDVYWYRTGEHKIEDNFQVPRILNVAFSLSPTPSDFAAIDSTPSDRYLKAKRPKLLSAAFAERTLVPHKHIYLVSPNLSFDLFYPGQILERLLARQLQFGCTIVVITCPPKKANLDQYRRLESLGVQLLVCQGLNARLFYFEVDRDMLDREQGHWHSTAFVGSAELTRQGLNIQLDADQSKEELSYRIEEGDLAGAEEFVFELMDNTARLSEIDAIDSLNR